MSQLATPFLYQNVYLPDDEQDEAWEKLHILANSSGVLDGHVRAIRIGASSYNDQRAGRPLRRLIESLPYDTLQSFWYSSLARPQREDLKLLWKTQKRLTNLLFDFRLNSPLSSDILLEDSLELRSMVSISQISVRLGAGALSPSAFEYIEMVINMFPNFRELMLQFTLGYVDDSHDESLLRATSFSLCLPRTLTHIRLHDVSIVSANKIPLDKLTVLKHLELVECSNTETLLNNYSKPALETFTYCHDCRGEADNIVGSTAVLEFLQRFQHLKRLIIDCQECLTRFESTAASSVTSHAASLEYLLINCETAHVEGPYEGSFLEAASKCKRLKQLSISFRVPDSVKVGAVRRNREISLSSLASR